MNSRLQHYFLNILSKRDYSEKILRDKAAEKNYLNNDVDEVMSWLKELKYVDDNKYAEHVVQQYNGKKGYQWIAQKLRMKGVSDHIISEAFSQNPSIVDDRLKKQIELKYNIQSWQNVEPNTVQKIAAFLARRGFASVWETIQQWRNTEDN